MNNVDLSIVIPCFNEEKRIENKLEENLSFLKKMKYTWELVVVNDGSYDNTLTLLKDYKKLEPRIKIFSFSKNEGKGAAVKKGVELAKGRVIFFMDADFSTPINQIYQFLKYIQKYHVVIGIRKHKLSKIIVRQPKYRELMGKTFTLISNKLFLKNIYDVTCGFKCFRSTTAKKIFKLQKIKRWVFDTEVLFLMQKYNYPVKQIPVVWRNDRNSKVSILKDVAVSLIDLLRIRIHDLLGFYN